MLLLIASCFCFYCFGDRLRFFHFHLLVIVTIESICVEPLYDAIELGNTRDIAVLRVFIFNFCCDID